MPPDTPWLVLFGGVLAGLIGLFLYIVLFLPKGCRVQNSGRGSVFAGSIAFGFLVSYLCFILCGFDARTGGPPVWGWLYPSHISLGVGSLCGVFAVLVRERRFGKEEGEN